LIVTLPELSDLAVDIQDGLATVVLDRPDVRNVISDPPLVEELPVVFDILGARDDVRVIVLTGRGSAFSAGGNIQHMHDRTGSFAGSAESIADGYRRGIQRLIRAVVGVEIPVIAAVNGPAIGAGFDLALACDLRLASRTARFGETFVKLGLIPGDGGSWLLPQAVGFQRAAELAYTGRLVEADEALALGLVLSVHEPDELMGAAFELAQSIAGHPGTALRYTKRLLARARAGTGFADILEEASTLQAVLHGTPAHAAAVQAMVDRIRT
jgi:enoyl-CoA hydratase/carnithine racemase